MKWWDKFNNKTLSMCYFGCSINGFVTIKDGVCTVDYGNKVYKSHMNNFKNEKLFNFAFKQNLKDIIGG